MWRSVIPPHRYGKCPENLKRRPSVFVFVRLGRIQTTHYLRKSIKLG